MFDWKLMAQQLRRALDIRKVYNKVKLSIKLNLLFYIIVLCYIIVMSTVTILKNHAFLTSGFDLGIYNQALYTTLFENKFFYETADLSFNPGGSFFGVHFSPILFLLLPFYAIYPSVDNLLVIQTVILALGAFPVYWMAQKSLRKNASALIALIYLLYPPLIMLNLNDFHVQAFTSTFFLFSVYYLEREKWSRFFVFLLMAMFTIEFAPIISIFVAIYAFILYRKNRLKNNRKTWIFIVATVSLAILMLIISLQVKVLFNNTTSPISTTFRNLFEDPAGIPGEIWKRSVDKIFYVIGFLAPLAFLPLLAPEPLIIALPWIGLSFVSQYPPYYSVFYQYTAFVIPFVMIALPKAIGRLEIRKGKKIVTLLLLATAISLIYIPLTSGAPWNLQFPMPNERSQLRHEILSLIPPKASVLAQNDIFPHVSGRINAYMYNATENHPIFTDYVVVDTTSEWYMWEPDIGGSKQNPRGYVEAAMAEGRYGVLASAGGMILLKKDYFGEPVLFKPIVLKENYQSLTLKTGSLVEDPTSESGYVFFHGRDDQKDTFFHGPYIGLPFGLYKVTYALKVDAAEEMSSGEPLIKLEATADAGKTFLEDRTVYGKDVPFSRRWFNVTLYFGLSTPAKQVEFRGHTNWNRNVYLDYVVLEQISAQPVKKPYFDYETFDTYARSVKPYVSWVQRGMVVDGVIKHLKGLGTGTFWYGPYFNYSSWPAGKYTAKFWLKLDELYHGKVLDLVVATNGGRNLLAQREIYSFNFKAIDVWQSFEVNFDLPEYTQGDSIEFAGMRALDYAPISFLLVEVYPACIPQKTAYQTAFDINDLILVNGRVTNYNIMTHTKGSGTFWHGPYTFLPAGNYIAKFHLKLDKDYTGILLDIDVAINSGKTIKSYTVTSSDFEEIDKWQTFDVKFTLQSDTEKVEFRGVNVRDLAPISFALVEVQPDGEPTQQGVSKIAFDGKDMKIVNGKISNGVAVHTKGSGTFWHGPYYNYSLLPTGKYTAKFWLRLDGQYDGPVLDLVVLAGNGSKLLGKLGVNGNDFKAINVWQSFEVNFDLPEYTQGDSIEFAGFIVRDLAPVSFLFVEVYPA
ncbi:MAG: DUF2079 domain-containing protein [Candidatus Bathyarchaeia archaeon]